MRQREGIELAKRERKIKGRAQNYHNNPAGTTDALKLSQEGEMTVKQICEITNISGASIYRKLLEITGLDSI